MYSDIEFRLHFLMIQTLIQPKDRKTPKPPNGVMIEVGVLSAVFFGIFSGVFFHVDFFPANLVMHTVLVFEDRREVLSVSKLKEQFEEAIRTKVIPYRNMYSRVGDTDGVYPGRIRSLRKNPIRIQPSRQTGSESDP